ncbi:proteinaceous RNase P 1, chloroplastic/mitochondrial-like [Chenopodium quinoa]|uniref:proteinaceous RNase P 1, chloroplastic/mitochondrial-like n=1 Tax=Chenopodium quinoa TaxID=63459 RepID=UPI000B78DE28|nr:proteinaceous RNase P 1, chloroplastic/mitochondrial-like [Chenopodium quinoa]
MPRIPVLMSLPRFSFAQCRPIFSLLHGTCNNGGYTHIPASSSLSFISKKTLFSYPFSSTFAVSAAATSSTKPVSSSDVPGIRMTLKQRKKARGVTPEYILKCKLDMCSKFNKLDEALRLYDAARVDGTELSLHHYNTLFYLCSNHALNGISDCVIDSLERGFEIFRQMGIDRVVPNEATFTSMARLAACKKDPEMAFDLVKQMKDSGNVPKLRSYAPALFGFLEKGDADGAYKVDAHMKECGVVAEEPELAALLKLSVDARRGDKVYEMLHRLRTSVRQVSEETARIVECWFKSETACGVGMENWDMGKVKEGINMGGGGWHGQGWLGSGKWGVVKTEMDKKGVCSSCGEKLVCIDIDPKETDNFACSLSSLACKKEKLADFLKFQRWLQSNGPFDAVVDGANVGLCDSESFDFRQLAKAVNRLQQISPTKKLPLVILHQNRVYTGPAETTNIKRMLGSWRKAGAIYATPQGSNDDWYWLYAAVRCNCLLLTNDEMRDHLFQLLGNSIFPRWKEKHQIRMTVSKSGLVLHMPPPYSIVTQESESGSWHIPTVTGDDLKIPRQWLCATRVTKIKSKVKAQLSN